MKAALCALLLIFTVACGGGNGESDSPPPSGNGNNPDACAGIRSDEIEAGQVSATVSASRSSKIGRVDPSPRWRVLDDGKEALGSTLLDGDPQGILRMPEETVVPLVLALALTGLFFALLAKATPWVVVAGVATLGTIGWWLWPHDAPRRAA